MNHPTLPPCATPGVISRIIRMRQSRVSRHHQAAGHSGLTAPATAADTCAETLSGSSRSLAIAWGGLGA